MAMESDQPELSEDDVFHMTTELREAYEIRTGQTIDDAVALRTSLEAALKSAGVRISEDA